MPTTPHTEPDPRYGDPGVQGVAWADAIDRLAQAQVYWIATLRPGAGPHVTPVIGVVSDEVFHFCTGVGEQKEVNLRADPHCTVLTGTNLIDAGTDVVVEGVADRVTGDGDLARLADAWVAKYGEEWRFEVSDGAFHHADSPAHDVPVFAVRPARAYAFGRGPASHTRYRFDT